MNLGRIIGVVVASVKDPSLLGVNLKVLQPLKDDLSTLGDPVVAADPFGARSGDIVMWVASREASLALVNKFAPVDAAVVGFADRVGDENTEVPAQ